MFREIGSILNILSKLENSASLVTEVQTQRCSNQKKIFCTKCKDICPVDAVVLEPTASIDVSKCVECGICGSTCPNEAISLGFYSDKKINSELIRASIKEGSKFTVGCDGVQGLYLDKTQRTEEPSLVVPCLGCVHETSILLSKLTPYNNIQFIPCDERCKNDKGKEAWEKNQKRFDILSQAFDLQSSKNMVNGLRTESNRINSRRGFLNSMGKTLQSTLFDVTLGRYLGKKESNNGTKKTGYRREILLELSSKLGVKSIEVSSDEINIGFPVIDEKCTICGICAHFCPMQALEKIMSTDYGEMAVVPAYCTSCGACVSLCPEQAISIEETVNLGGLSRNGKKLIRKTLVVCPDCNTKFFDDGESTRCH